MTAMRTMPSRTDFSARARGALQANATLLAFLSDSAGSIASLSILLFLAAEDDGHGVTTMRCCEAVDAPRTTTLRWIATLARLGMVEQMEDAHDRRITRLRLTERATAALQGWLAAMAGTD